MRTKSFSNPYERERRWFYIALTLVVISSVAYTYFLSASVMHVVMRKEIGKEIASMNTEISRLETRYIEAQHTMSEEVANQKGFVAAHDKIFIDTTTPTLVLSTN